MRKIIIPIICIFSILIVLLTVDKISDTIITYLNPTLKANSFILSNNYRNKDFVFVSNTQDFTPYGKQDLLNIFYTVLNNRINDFTFYCAKEYKDCIKDVKNISKDENMLTHLNNFVHPYHSFNSINTDITDNGEITLKINYIYNDEKIKKINEEVYSLIKKIITEEDKEDYDKIKKIHDYIIDNTKYDIDNNKEIESYNAYGALFNHFATCNGYTDLMAIFLTKMGYDNFKIATTNEISGHVWNAVKVKDEWLHLDLTWDDPVSSNGKNYLYHKYFLITTEELKTADKNITSKEHEFNPTIYSELKTTSLKN